MFPGRICCMPQPQAGIIPDPSPNALFLILRVREPATNGRAVAKVAAGLPALVNKSSCVFTQRYVHNLQKWATVPQKEQEKVIGRRKPDSTELSDRIKPPTAHISRVVIEEQGQELEIVRHSFPYGTVSESGLFFIAYTKTLDIPEKMLSRMMGTSGDFFAPSLEVLKSLGSR
ncbi:MAG: Dyp-type peroxidase [Deltaproteobacteria bacterium]|nr:Dyp-type peroxidase [Deltaproteobacteria bacterium]